MKENNKIKAKIQKMLVKLLHDLLYNFLIYLPFCLHKSKYSNKTLKRKEEKSI